MSTKIELPAPAMHSISKAFEKKAKFETGEHAWEGRVILDVTTVVKKGADTEYVPTVAIPFKRVMAVALSRMGFQRDKIIEIMLDATLESSNMNEELAAEFDELSKKAEELFNKEVAAKLPKQKRSGTTTWKGLVKPVKVTVR